MKPLIVFLFSAVLLTNCTQNNQHLSGDSKSEINAIFEEKNFKSEESIYNGDTIFAEMSYRYPVFSGGEEKVIKRLNEYILSLNQDEYLSEPTETKSSGKTLEEIANNFFREAKAAEVENYPYAPAWSYELTTDTLLIDHKDQVLTLVHWYNTYLGGAHPNHFARISNIDLQTGDTLSYDSLFRNNKQLIEAVKQRFIENEKKVLSENGSVFNLSDYWFEAGFKLPQAMGLTREGIRCIYIPYEVAPYARGAIDFTVPYDDIPNFKVRK